MNELIDRYVGCECQLLLGTSGGSVKGTVLSVCGNWIELQVKKDTRLLNIDYVSSIQVLR